MSYLDKNFAFLFLPCIIFLYNIFPQKIRRIILLLTGYIFFFLCSGYLFVFLILSTLSIYFAGIKLKKYDEEKDNILKNASLDDKKIIKEKYKKKKKRVLALTIIFNLLFLATFKYLKFFTININTILKFFSVNYSFKVLKLISPIGISYYTLEAISYLVDVYNNKIEADKNILRLSIYLSFFPQIMEGPITNYNETAYDLYEAKKSTYKNCCFGYQRILYGFAKKLVIADRLNPLVKEVFNNYSTYSGLAILLAVVGYTLMLYSEFSGTMDVVIGTGEIFGIKIPENFREPFFAKNISEFWSRWHITLGRWFKEYIFYPVSLSKKCKKITINARKKLGNRFGPLVSGSIALLSVWLLNGLWHGAGWTYIFYGIYHFTLILLGNLFEPTIASICKKIKINRENIVYRIFRSVKMTIFVFIGELFFRAPTIKSGFAMLTKIFTDFNFKGLKNGEILSLGLDIKDYILLIITVILLFIIGLIKEKGINIREKISEKNIVFRWTIYFLLIFIIIIFGAYGPGYDPVDPIYADF